MHKNSRVTGTFPLCQGCWGVPVIPGDWPAGEEGRGAQEQGAERAASPATCLMLIYEGWHNLSKAVILTSSAPGGQSRGSLREAFTSPHKSSKMKTQGPLKYTPRVSVVQLEAFMTPVRAFMTP